MNYLNFQVLIGNFSFCQIYGISWYTLDTSSIFVMAILNLCRTISIYKPFRAIKRRTVLVPIIFFISINLLDTSYPVWLGSFYFADNDGVQCNYNVGKILGRGSLPYKIYWTLHISINRVIVPLMIIVCCVLSSVKIWKKRETKVGCAKGTDGGIDFRQRRKHEATTTVVLLGVFYIVLNLPYNVIYSIQLYHFWNESTWWVLMLLARCKFP